MERSDLRLMIHTAVWCLVVAGILFAVFSLGRAFQHAKNGFRYEVSDEKVIEFPRGPLRLQHAHKTIGLGFMDWDRSILILDLPQVGKVTVYEAQHSMDKSSPYVNEVTVDWDEISWDDRHFRYRLKVEPVGTETYQKTEENQAQ